MAAPFDGPHVFFHNAIGKVEMTGNKYKRTNFDDDESGAGTPPGRSYEPSVVFKASASVWHSRSVLEKAMFMLVMLFLLVVIILAILLSAKHIQVRHVIIHNKTEYCMTPECVNVASRLLSNMDRSVDPCYDFYMYSCGNWIKTHPIPEGHSQWGTFNKKWKENQLIMKNALDFPLNATKSTAEQKAKLYYQSCMDETGVIEKLGAKPLLDVIKDAGGWNINDDNFDIKTWDFQKTLETAHSKYALGTFFAMFISTDEKDSSRNMIKVDQSGLGLPTREYYINKTVDDDKILGAYLEYMLGLGRLLGASNRNISEPLFRDMIDFETRIAEITTPQADRRDEELLYHKMTVADLQKIAPVFDWLHYLNNMFKATDIEIKSDEEIVVYAPDFLSNISAIVEDMLKTDAGKITLNTYLGWHIAKSLDGYLSQDFETVERAFKKALSGTSGKEEKWRECVSDVDATVGFALGAMFVKSAFHGDSKTTAENMVRDIKLAFKKSLPSLAWMDKETVSAALEKVDAVIDMIGFPDYIMNVTALDERYEDLRIEKDEYFGNNLRNLRFELMRELSRLRKKPDKKRWSMTPPTINAYYAPAKNMIVFPAGILQMPFYDKDYPKSLNFGGVGVVVGHELSHGFDDQGREYDKYGNLRPWWNKDVIKRFKERTKCMINQYSQYTINGEHIKGEQTVGENIADNGGLKAAYSAYQKWRKLHGQTRALPGVNMTDDQLFFLGFAQVWCSIATKETYHLQLVSDAHTPAQYRVVGTLSNSKDFAKHFKCPSGTPMNPVKKCEVW